MVLAETRRSDKAAQTAAVAARIESLEISQFRNYRALSVRVAGAPLVVITGANGIGKTNILEAISLLTPGRGLRQAGLAEWRCQLPNSEGTWAVAAEVRAGDRLIIGTGQDPESTKDRRIVKVDGKRLRAQSELAEKLSVVWLTPQMDQLFTGPSTERRRFFDRLAYGFHGQHASHINRYDKAMRERNRLLQEPGADPHWLGAVEQRMAEAAIDIAAARLDMLVRLNKSIMDAATSFPRAHVAATGFVEDRLAAGLSAEETMAHFAAELRNKRGLDAACGRALAGVHRTGWQVTHLVKNREASGCSTGEQKAMLLTVLLAHARACGKSRGKLPILLLDEVVAHLDPARREQLLDEVVQTGVQAWLTGTDKTLFKTSQNHASFYTVEQGNMLETGEL